jgi:hypothetical protein
MLVGLPIIIFVLRKRPVFKWLIAGIVTCVAGTFIIGVFSSLILFCIGLAIYSVGMFVAYSFYFVTIANSSPKRRMAVLMGLAFVPVLITDVLVPMFNLLFSDLLIRSGRVYFFTTVVCSLGMVTVVLLLLYHSSSLKMERAEPAPRRKFHFRPSRHDPIISSKATLLVCIIIIPLLLGSGVFSVGIDVISNMSKKEEPKEIPFDLDEYDVYSSTRFIGGGYLPEQTSVDSEYTVELDEGKYIRSITFCVYWDDEPDKDPGIIGLRKKENQPDTFSMEVFYNGDPDKTEGTAFTQSEGPETNAKGSIGIVTFFAEFEHDSRDSLGGRGDWTITVTCEDAGDFEGTLTSESDDGNTFDLEMTIEVYEPPSEEEEE